MDTPTLSFVAEVEVLVGAPIAVGETGEGLRRVVPIIGGTFRGPNLSGKVLAAGADYQVIRSDGFTTLDARYAIELDDGQLLYVVNKGIRHGSPEVMARITSGESVDPDQVYFRTAPRIETASPDLAWLSRSLLVATGARYPNSVALQIFRVD